MANYPPPATWFALTYTPGAGAPDRYGEPCGATHYGSTEVPNYKPTAEEVNIYPTTIDFLADGKVLKYTSTSDTSVGYLCDAQYSYTCVLIGDAQPKTCPDQTTMTPQIKCEWG